MEEVYWVCLQRLLVHEEWSYQTKCFCTISSFEFVAQSPCDTLRLSKPQVCSPQMGQLVV